MKFLLQKEKKLKSIKHKKKPDKIRGFIKNIYKKKLSVCFYQLLFQK